MTKKNYTHIEVLLDESGSMQSIKDGTLEGFNSFLMAQKQAPGQASIGFSKFSKIESYSMGDKFDIVRNWYSYSVIQNAPELADKDFTPNGMTPLHDAICKVIDNTGRWLGFIPEDERPEKVLFVIITDGLENASQNYNAKDVKERITRQTEQYKWQFVYLGANQDAILVGESLGISQDSSMTYTANNVNTKRAFRAVTLRASDYRAGDSFTFTTEDRNEQENV